MSRPLSIHTRRLISEARDLQQRKYFLEKSLGDEEDLNETTSERKVEKLCL